MLAIAELLLRLGWQTWAQPLLCEDRGTQRIAAVNGDQLRARRLLHGASETMGDFRRTDKVPAEWLHQFTAKQEFEFRTSSLPASSPLWREQGGRRKGERVGLAGSCPIILVADTVNTVWPSIAPGRLAALAG